VTGATAGFWLSLKTMEPQHGPIHHQMAYVPGSGQGKHPTRATKLDLLQFVAGCPGADVVTVTQRFGLSDIGARCKLWRLEDTMLRDV